MVRARVYVLLLSTVLYDVRFYVNTGVAQVKVVNTGVARVKVLSWHIASM
jgi:hypothetical protein